MLAIATILSAAACSQSGTLKGDSALTSAGVSSQDPATSASPSPADSSSAADTAAATPDPCVLVTKAEARALAGMALDDAVKAGQDTDSPSCTYTAPATGSTGQVEVHVGPGAKKYYDLERDGLKHDLQAAPGIGDEAWTDKDDLTIFVRKGDAWFAIHLVILDDPDKFIPRLRQAGKTAVARA
ncbi:MAG: DUF3558 family protein [Catenulispora sp.]|nr:DUF3558 family protein [Catenulispora sp.]